MKKLLSVLAIAILLPVIACAEIDLSAMSYDELVELSKQVGLAIMNHESFDSVSVPIGLWEVGVDIPEGTWVLTSSNGNYVSVTYGTTVGENGNSMDISSRGNTDQTLTDDTAWRVTAKKGCFFEIEYGSVTFTSDTGNSSLGFKKRN